MLPLEDELGDILLKAQRGLELDSERLAAQTGLDPTVVRLARRGSIDLASLCKLAAALHLRPAPLLAIQNSTWHAKVELPRCIHAFTTPFGDGLTVNAYVLHDSHTNEALIFDSGIDSAPIRDFLEQNSLKPQAILLTHTHRDHIEGLSGLLESFPHSVVHSPAAEPLEGAQPFHSVNTTWRCGRYKIESLATPGHSPGGTSFVITDDSTQQIIATIVGDALFAGSIGGIRAPIGQQTLHETYLNGIQTIKQQLLTLPGKTVLCPGHGPATTVAQELEHNPFF